MGDSKPDFSSRMWWVNVVTLVLGILGLILGNEFIAEYPTLVAILVACQGALNLVLRYLTTGPIQVFWKSWGGDK